LQRLTDLRPRADARSVAHGVAHPLDQILILGLRISSAERSRAPPATGLADLKNLQPEGECASEGPLAIAVV
jgi:hypothetical protein